jgi:hypothetical protein
MTYTTADGRAQLLDMLGGAVAEIGIALSDLGEAYELLDEQTADRLEKELFGPVQAAYGKAQRAYGSFAERYGLPGKTFEQAPRGAPSTGAKGFIDLAVEAVARADQELAGLQDSMLPIEVGDAELRAGLQEVRELLDVVRKRAKALERTLGR